MSFDVEFGNGSFIGKTLVWVRIIILVIFFCINFTIILIYRIKVVFLIFFHISCLKIILIFLDRIIMLYFLDFFIAF